MNEKRLHYKAWYHPKDTTVEEDGLAECEMAKMILLRCSSRREKSEKLNMEHIESSVFRIANQLIKGSDD